MPKSGDGEVPPIKRKLYEEEPTTHFSEERHEVLFNRLVDKMLRRYRESEAWHQQREQLEKQEQQLQEPQGEIDGSSN